MIAVFAGSFDPFTIGHYEIVAKSTKLFDKIIIAIAKDNCKSSSLSVEKRKEIIELSIGGLSNVVVDSFSGALTDYMLKNNCTHMVRGLRNTIDFTYEKDLSAVYKDMCESVEQVYFMSSVENSHISSTAVRELVKLNKDCKKYVIDKAYKKVVEYYK